jgi:hypothetical protein
VVFPQPEGPRRKNNSPELIVRSIPSTASVLSYFFVKPVSEIDVITQDNSREINGMLCSQSMSFDCDYTLLQCTIVGVLNPELQLKRLRKWRAMSKKDTSINDTLQAMRKGLRKSSRQSTSVVEAWDVLVPSHIARQATIVSMRSGVLEVVTDGSAIAYQLNRLVRSGLLRDLQLASKGTLRKIKIRST